jgi:hypothetical protein
VRVVEGGEGESETGEECFEEERVVVWERGWEGRSVRKARGSSLECSGVEEGEEEEAGRKKKWPTECSGVGSGEDTEPGAASEGSER